MSNELNPFIGTGWSFPPTFRSGGKDLDLVTGRKEIEDSLHILLSTALRERVMQPAYGCNLDAMLFQSMNEHFKTYLTHLVTAAITFYEARIIADSIDVVTDDTVEGRVLIVINYTIRSTNSTFNFVFPFYLQF